MPPLQPTVATLPAFVDIAPGPLLVATVDEMNGPAASADRWMALDRYLRDAGNIPEDIDNARTLFRMANIILEIGGGDGEVARRIALKNPHMAVIATDAYHLDAQPQLGSHYRQVALAWQRRQLAAQQNPPGNLALLKAEVEILRHLPARCLDALLLINAEPKIGKAILERLADCDLYQALRPGPRQLVILPYCREMGVCACGGYEFEHDADWSRGLGYFLASRFAFRRADRVQWGIDLPRASRYTGNSTQTDVYVAGGLKK